jgi:hypothetical protein
VNSIGHATSRRTVAVAVMASALSACASSATPAGDGATDVAHAAIDTMAPIDASPGVDAGGFCADPNSARLALNGVVAESPAASASEVFLNCCEAGVIRVVTARFTDAIAVSWRHQLGASTTNIPVTLDLANLPPEWSVTLTDGCDPTMSSCTPTDQYASGMTGTLHIERTPSGQLRMSVCLDASEPASMPHPVVHSLQLWVPPVTAM